MGFFSSLFGGGGPSKNDVIRSLAKTRLRLLGIDDGPIDSLGMLQLAGLPESTIATIVESYGALKKRGESDEEIFLRIESHRAQIGSGDIPEPLTLESYVQYRIDVEHSHGAVPIDEGFITAAVRICREHFGC